MRCGIIVEASLILLEFLPADVARMSVGNECSPLVAWQLLGTTSTSAALALSRTTKEESACISWVM
jgi:hypothetical protein